MFILSLFLSVFILAGCTGSKLSSVPVSGEGEMTVYANPEDFGFSVPDPEPSLPAGVDSYAPPKLETSESGPLIARTSKSAQPDQILSLTGVDLNGATKLKVFGQTTASSSSLLLVDSLKADSTAATFLLPTTLPQNSMYLIWPDRNGVRGKAFAVNRTEAWWVGPDQAVAGDTVSVYGRNLSKNGGTTTSFIYIKPANSAGQYVTATSVNPFKVDFTVPALTAGHYEVWIHNGHGGHFGWSGPLDLEVLAQSAWAGQSAQTFDVTAYGATGDGATDDTTAIKAAISAAESAAPATVYFPSGTYLVTATLSLSDNVRWLGDGMDLSEVRLNATLTDNLVGSVGDNTQIEKLTVNGNENTGTNPVLWVGGAENFRIQSARINAWGTAVLEANGAEHLFIESSELIENGSFYGSSTQVFFTNNDFRMTEYGESVAAFWGGHDFSMVGNDLANADESIDEGHGIGRFFVAQGHFGSMKNMYWGENVSHKAAPHDCNLVDCNKGEQICFEMVGSDLLTGFTGATASTISFSSFPAITDAGGADIVVVGGRGAGQYRHVQSVSGNTATLEAPWNVIPDNTSQFALSSMASKAAIYNNTFEGRSDYGDPNRDTDSTAVLLYGNVTDMVVDSNHVSQMRHGLMTVALDAPNGYSPYFLQYSNNEVTDSFNGFYVGVTFTDSGNQPGVWGGLGNIYRNNTVSDITHIGVEYEIWDYNGADYNGTVFEKNTFTNLPYGFINAYQLMWTYDGDFDAPPTDSPRMYNTILYQNSFSLGTATLSGSVGFVTLQPDNTWLNLGSTWTGFASGNSGP